MVINEDVLIRLMWWCVQSLDYSEEQKTDLYQPPWCGGYSVSGWALGGREFEFPQSLVGFCSAFTDSCYS